MVASLRKDNGPVLLFDGKCNMCQWWVRFVIRHEQRDRSDRFRFASLRSAYANDALRLHGFDASTLDTLTVVDGDRVLLRSDAVICVTTHLRKPWQWLRFGRIVPRFIRDTVYRLIAKSRFRLFGRAEACLVPTEELRERFLDV